MLLADLVLAALLFLAALLYASVGHGGGSGYLAAMAFMGVSPALMKPAALSLNILVAGLATWRYASRGCFSWPLFWPFALASVPMAFVGGMAHLPDGLYKPVVGAVLLFAAWRMWHGSKSYGEQTGSPPRIAIALAAGAVLGLLSGLTGVGGGIFLSPLILMMAWAGARQTAGVSAAFILANSIAGLAGHLAKGASLPDGLVWWAIAAVVGGWIGADLGSKRLARPMIIKLLALVLAVAGLKMLVV